MTCSVRLARESDADAVAALTAQLGYEVAADVLRPRLARILERPNQRFLIAEAEGRAAGWLHAVIAEYVETGEVLVIAGLVVDRGCRRQGIGQTLMAHAEQWGRERGCPTILLSSSQGRAGAHAFYESLGYAKLKTQFAFGKSADPGGQDPSKLAPRIAE
jgi:GNAT superfamily N-acetyltransferase